jgi:uncharacterized 2Fe-2S/4Fe-4S cluster protein (DUF4445 family)
VSAGTEAGSARASRPGRLAAKTLFDLADELREQVPTSCRRTGRCHECVVEVTQGMVALGPATEAEAFLSGPYRLACQAEILDARVPVRFEALRLPPQILTAGLDDAAIEIDPLVTRRGHDVLYDGEVVDRYRGHICGLAIDLGTTTVVVDLVDLETGRTLEQAAFENPQRFGGSDVMHRISYDAGDPRGELRRSAVRAVNHAVAEMTQRIDIPRQAIYEVVVAGNTTMRDILFRTDVQSIGQRPYKSRIEHEFLAGRRPHTALLERSRRLGLRVNPRAMVYGAPLIASHVGGDTAAALLAVGMTGTHDDVRMLIDVGTNTEVVVGNSRRMIAASCPAGPAFEGGAVKYGMPGREGAVESLRLGPLGEATTYRTIGGGDPRGFCGSGLIDLLAELHRGGLMNHKGGFVADRKRFDMAILPEHGITFSRADAGHLGQAKAANYCGQLITMREFGVDPGEISTLYLAGGFASYVNVDNAIEIGFLAPVPRERIVKVGNAAIQGARKILLSRPGRTALESLVQDIEHIELETTPDFFELFVDGCQLKPMPEVFRPEATAE